MQQPLIFGKARTFLAHYLARSWLPGTGAIVVVLSFASSLVIGAAMISAIGISPLHAFAIAFDGSIGTVPALADTLVYATPRLLAALCAIVALRCGLFNLGGEGQLQLGAVGATLVGTWIPSLFAPLHVLLALLAAMALGAFWATIAALLKLWRQADEIIVTLMMNFIAIYFVNYLVQGPMQPPDSDYNMSAKIAHTAQFPVILAGTRLHLGFVLAVGVALAIWFLLYRTPLGVHLRATGLNARATMLQGLPVRRLMFIAMALSGAVGGLAGANEVQGVQFRLIEGFSSNFGFDGLAIAFLSGLEPLPAVAVAIYFGAIENGVTSLQSALSVPSSLAMVLSGLPILTLAAAQGWYLLKGRSLWATTF